MNLQEFFDKYGEINVTFAERVISQTRTVDEILQYWMLQDLIGSTIFHEAFAQSCQEDMAQAFGESDRIEMALKVDMDKAQTMIKNELRERLKKEELGGRGIEVAESITAMLWEFEKAFQVDDLRAIVNRFRHNAYIANYAIGAYKTSIDGR